MSLPVAIHHDLGVVLLGRRLKLSRLCASPGLSRHYELKMVLCLKTYLFAKLRSCESDYGDKLVPRASNGGFDNNYVSP